MVGSDIEYVVVEAPVPGTDCTARYVLAEARLATYARELAADGEQPKVVGHYRGADLVGRTYTPPFSYFLGRPARSASSPPTTRSPPPTAPGWSTPPARSVRSTRRSPTARASRR